MLRRLFLNLIVPDRALRWRGPVTVWSFDMALRHFYVPLLRERLNHVESLLRGRPGD